MPSGVEDIGVMAEEEIGDRGDEPFAVGAVNQEARGVRRTTLLPSLLSLGNLAPRARAHQPDW